MHGWQTTKCSKIRTSWDTLPRNGGAGAERDCVLNFLQSKTEKPIPRARLIMDLSGWEPRAP
jgi:hypothetical protein